MLLERERAAYAELRPRSRAAFAAARASLLGGVPMTWMAKRAGGFPLYHAEAHGNRNVDLDGRESVDFCLGDTGSMTGHSPAPTVEAVQRRLGQLGGATAMLPTEDAARVAGELSRRCGERRWSFALTATDANRWAIRIARRLTGRPKLLCSNPNARRRSEAAPDTFVTVAWLRDRRGCGHGYFGSKPHGSTTCADLVTLPGGLDLSGDGCRPM